MQRFVVRVDSSCCSGARQDDHNSHDVKEHGAYVARAARVRVPRAYIYTRIRNVKKRRGRKTGTVRGKLWCSEWSNALVHVEKHRAKVHVHLERVPRLLSTHLQVKHTVKHTRVPTSYRPPSPPPDTGTSMFV